MWLSAPDGSTDYFNERGTGYTGLFRRTNYGWGGLQMVHDADAPMAKTAHARAVATVIPFELNYRIRRFDGRYRWHAFRALPIRGRDGEVERWVETAVDVEERVELAERLRRIQDQTSDLLGLLNSLQPEPNSFRFVERAVRALRANVLLASDRVPSQGGLPRAKKGPTENDPQRLVLLCQSDRRRYSDFKPSDTATGRWRTCWLYRCAPSRLTVLA